jgi:hypothetical protein
VSKPKTDTISKAISVVKPDQKIFPPPPLVLKTRENALVKKIETEASEIKIELYDNGEIDGDTISIYHNNTLIRSNYASFSKTNIHHYRRRTRLNPTMK